VFGSAQVAVLEQQTNLNFFRGFEYDPTCDAILVGCVCKDLKDGLELSLVLRYSTSLQ